MKYDLQSIKMWSNGAISISYRKLDDNGKYIGSIQNDTNLSKEATDEINAFKRRLQKILEKESNLENEKNTYKGYILCERTDNKFQTYKSRPYDDADYYWARTEDKLHWDIIYKGRKRYEWVGTFEQIIDELENFNSKISAKIIHN